MTDDEQQPRQFQIKKPLHLHGAGAFLWTRELKMNTQKISPLKYLTTAEVCDRYGFSRFTLSRRMAASKFPSPTGKAGAKNVWDVKVLEDFDETMRKLSAKSWTRALANV